MDAETPGIVATEAMPPVTPERMTAADRMGGPSHGPGGDAGRGRPAQAFPLADAASYILGQILAVLDGQQIRARAPRRRGRPS